MHGADAGSAVAEGDDGDAPVLLELRGQAQAASDGRARAHDPGSSHQADVRPAHAHGSALAAGGAAGLAE
ncbi:MAG: hypothetical protein P8Y15_15675 [Gemmatimonadales bacterium]